MNNIKLYDWQKECQQIWLDNNTKGIVKVVTGAGKTIFALSCIDLLPKNLKIKIIVPTLQLSKQWKTTIKNLFLNEEVDEFNGRAKLKRGNRFEIYVVNSARYTLSSSVVKDVKDGGDVFLIFDECHHYGSKENQKVFHYKKSPNIDSDKIHTLGLSATPECENYDVLLDNIGPLIFEYDFDKATKNNYISNYNLFQIGVSLGDAKLKEVAKIDRQITFNYQILSKKYPSISEYEDMRFFNHLTKLYFHNEDENIAKYLGLIGARREIILKASNRISCCVELIKRLNKKKKIIVFSERIEQATYIKNEIESNLGIKCSIYHSKMDQNIKKMNLDNFNYNSTRVLVVCKALDEGFDVPNVDVGIILSTSKQERQRIQRLGRILRISESKKHAIIYYIYVYDSNDEKMFLYSNKNRSVANMYFKDGEFENESYWHYANLFRKNYLKNTPSTYKMIEIDKCLKEGEFEGDYLLDLNMLENLTNTAENKHLKNYYFCMKKIVKLKG